MAPRPDRPAFARWLWLLRLVLPLLLLGGSGKLQAHAFHISRLSIALTADEAELRIETNLAPLLGGADAAANFLGASAEARDARLTILAEDLLRQVTPTFTPEAAPWRLISTRYPATTADAEATAADPGAIADAAFVWRTRLADAPAATTLQVFSKPDARLEFPVACSVLLPGAEKALTHWLQSPGDSTRPLLSPGVEPTSLVANSATSDGPHAPEPFGPDGIATIAQYLRLGFLHILPLGVDHILFVLGLYFLGAGWRALAAQIGTFTLAHTTTLGLAAAGIVRVSPAIVEPLIALSIAFVALENIFRPRIGAGRLVVVFVFGLLHGLGFAGALSELAMPRDRFFTALLSFNFGVDFGQLAVLALAFLTFGWFRKKTWYRDTLAVPACALIAAIGVYWTVERTFF